jgi:uncharacterized protein YprB with RNaseH-like and TPR domain
MAEYYFDTETTGRDFQKDKIITIQWQRVNGFTGEPIGELQILKEWETSEKEILKQFLPNIKCKPFDFILVGKNLLFDFTFLDKRLKHHNLGEFDLRCAYERVFLDIKPILVMINKGNFIGYDRVLDKDDALAKMDIPQLYKEKKYPEIIKYIQEETNVFLKAYQIFKREMPLLVKHL